MFEHDIRLYRLLGFAAAMLLAFALQKRSPHAGLRGSSRVNGGLWLVDLAVTGAFCGACVCSTAEWAAERNLGLLASAAAPVWLAIAISVVALDFVSWAWHRANHLVPFLWRWHQVHHSDPTFTVSTSLRFHPGELLLSLPLRALAVVLLGAPVVAVVVFEVAFTFANAFEHGDIDLPARFEAAFGSVFVTPALHRWHHTVAKADRDRNFGTIFSVWDRLFGSYTANDSRAEVRTGLPGVPGIGLTDALRMPFRAVPGASAASDG